MKEIPEAKPLFDERHLPTFVGREKDLILFNSRWESPRVEFSVIKIANMPGIGKTEVVRQFFRTYGMSERNIAGGREHPLLIQINCKKIAGQMNEFQSPNDAYKLTMVMKGGLIKQLNFHYRQTGNRDEYKQVLDLIAETEAYKFSFWTFMEMLFNSDLLGDKYRLFFFDEIQSLYGEGIESILSQRNIENAEKWLADNPGKYPNRKNCMFPETVKLYQQGAFRKMASLIADLISQKTLIFVSGTQYSLLN